MQTTLKQYPRFDPTNYEGDDVEFEVEMVLMLRMMMMM
jgi:hypothetical protein